MIATANPPRLGERRNTASRLALLHRVRAEFREMPCLRLTAGQVQRLFGLRPDVRGRVLDALVQERTLTPGPDARYSLRVSAERQAAVSFDEE